MELSKSFNNYIFGCDICQDVCPWNKFSKPNDEQLLKAKDEIKNFSRKDWIELTNEVFDFAFKDSPINRAKYQGLKRNIKYASKQF